MRPLIVFLMALCAAIPAIADQQATVIGQLQTRDKLIVMMLGADELLYTIKDNSGKVIVSQLTEDQIREKHLDLHVLVNELIASQHGKGASFVEPFPAKGSNLNSDAYASDR